MDLPALIDKNPTELGFPPMLPVELALGNGTPKQLLEEYGLNQDDWERLKLNRVFLQACKEARDMAASEGGSFRMKAKTMAEVLLKDIHEMAAETDPNRVPSNVRADLLKFVVRIAGLDASIDQKGAAAGKGVSAVQAIININLG
jgi:hypothetical protein